MFKKLLIILIFSSYAKPSDSDKDSTPTLIMTPRNYSLNDDLFDNGILGRGFVAKSEESLRREEILNATRKDHDLVMQRNALTHSLGSVNQI